MVSRVFFTSCETENAEELFTVESDRLSFEKSDEQPFNELISGTYNYESEAMFGSKTTETGCFYVDSKTQLVAFLKENDTPKAKKIVRDIREETTVTLVAPSYPVEASHRFYETYGFNGFTTSFRDNLKEYTLESDFQSVDPERKAEERAKYSHQSFDENLVEKETKKCLDKEMYVSYMDVQLSQNGPAFRFNSPLSFSSFPEEKIEDTEFIERLFERAKELINNDVKTVSEVISD